MATKEIVMKIKSYQKLILSLSVILIVLGLTLFNLSNLYTSSITGGTSVNATLNQPYTTKISIPFTPYTTCSIDPPTSPCDVKYGKWFIMDNAKVVKIDSGWSSELKTSPYTSTVTYTPTVAGLYYLIAVIDTQHYVYSSSGWSMTESIESKEAQQINAKIPAPVVTTPTLSINSIIASILDWLKSIYNLLT